MKNKTLKGWHAVEYMQEQKKRINKLNLYFYLFE